MKDNTMTTVYDERESFIDLYTTIHSQDGAKILIILEELGLPYRLHKANRKSSDADRAKPGCEHGPTSDKDNDSGPVAVHSKHSHLTMLKDINAAGDKIHLLQAGPIAQYLIRQYDADHHISYPQGSPQEAEVNNWFFFVTANISPNHKEAIHFTQQAPEKIPYSIDRFTNKTLRRFFSLEQHLGSAKSDYIVGSKLTIADIALIPYIIAADAVGIDIERFPFVTSWYDRMIRRPSVMKALKELEMDSTIQ